MISYISKVIHHQSPHFPPCMLLFPLVAVEMWALNSWNPLPRVLHLLQNIFASCPYLILRHFLAIKFFDWHKISSSRVYEPVHIRWIGSDLWGVDSWDALAPQNQKNWVRLVGTAFTYQYGELQANTCWYCLVLFGIGSRKNSFPTFSFVFYGRLCQRADEHHL